VGLVTQPAPVLAGARTGYQLCTRCIMDTSDSSIVFDADGVCSNCKRAESLLSTRLQTYRTGAYRIDRLVEAIKASGKGKPYDCVMGVSGGVDSTYVAYIARQHGLRPLAVHFDNGWNAELAVHNIHHALETLGVELYTHVVDWEEFRDLQLSFLKASVSDAEIPTDHGIWSLLYKTAAKFGIKYVLSGTNIMTESILPRSWTHYVTDWTYVKDIHRRFGTKPLKTFPHASMAEFAWLILVRKVRMVSILNAVDYDKATAVGVLERELGWRNYGGKHHESIYTRFFQQYILPVKFGIDKRRAHLSSLIMAGQMTREQALAEVSQPSGDPAQLRRDLEYVAKKFDLSVEAFEAIMALPVKTSDDYRSDSRRFEQGVALMRKLQRLRLLPPQVGP
jgi:N-acetyl sugar amidotransferase